MQERERERQDCRRNRNTRTEGRKAKEELHNYVCDITDLSKMMSGQFHLQDSNILPVADKTYRN